MTDSALSRILKELRANPFPHSASRSECHRAALAEFDDDMRLSIELPLTEAPWTWTWELCKPCRLVQRSVEASPALRRLFERSQSSPAAPWSIVLAHDEITPGAVLRPDNARKFTCFYFTFDEFGDHTIRSELSWFLVAVARSTMIAKVPGGLSAMLKHLLRALVIDASGFTNGVVLPLSTPTLLFAKFRTHLGDEAALARGYSENQWLWHICPIMVVADTRGVLHLGGLYVGPEMQGYCVHGSEISRLGQAML